MAAEQEGRSLAETPTWSVATVTTLMVAACFLVERSLSRFAKVDTSHAPPARHLLALLSCCSLNYIADPRPRRRLLLLLLLIPSALRAAVAAQDQAEGHARRAREDPRR